MAAGVIRRLAFEVRISGQLSEADVLAYAALHLDNWALAGCHRFAVEGVKGSDQLPITTA